MFTHAIVRNPGKSITDGIHTADLGLPDIELAREQHSKYVAALRACGLEVTILDADEKHPDSTFVEDIALLKGELAIITRPGELSRRTETLAMDSVLTDLFPNIEYILDPGTLEGGDIMMVGDRFFIGISNRTNEDGARQIIQILEKYGYSGSIIHLRDVLHLKTGVSCLEQNNLLVCGEFVNCNDFLHFNRIVVPESEAYAANSLWINNKVLVPEGFPQTLKSVQNAGFETISLDVSEFQKLDGGLSCLSLRF